MEITKVKQVGDGYLVNDTLSVPNAPGNRHYQMIQEWLSGDVGRFIEPEFTAEEIAANEAAAIKQAAKDEIKKWIAEGDDMILETQLVLSSYTVNPTQGMANMTALEPIQNLLKNGSLKVARQAIVDLDLTGLSLTEQDRTDLLAILDEKLIVLES